MSDDDARLRGYYTQPLELLDLAWDQLHEEDVRPIPPFKTMSQILADRVDPADISHIIDVAITAYRWRGVPSGIFMCTYCGDQTERDEDPDPRVCAMCVKLPGRRSAP